MECRGDGLQSDRLLVMVGSASQPAGSAVLAPRRRSCLFSSLRCLVVGNSRAPPPRATGPVHLTSPPPPPFVASRIPAEQGGELHTSMEVSACQGSAQAVNFLEHVQCKVTLSHVPRGGLRILLASPSGTVSTLLFERPQDVLGSSFDRWPFMSVHFWGERPEGVWNLTVVNTKPAAARADGVLKEWQLILYGTEQEPVRLRPPETQQVGDGTAGVTGG